MTFMKLKLLQSTARRCCSLHFSKPINCWQQQRQLPQQKCRWYSFTKALQQGKNQKKKDPFVILGVPPGSSFELVKEQFLKLALKYHPDQQQQESSKTKNDSNNKNAHKFVEIRQAFERIQAKNGNGIETDYDDDDDDDYEDDLHHTEEEHHNYNNHNHHNPNFSRVTLDYTTRKEIAKVVEQMGPSGIDDETWRFAWHIANQGPGRKPLKQVTSSSTNTTTTTTTTTTIIRTRRKRRR